MKKNFKAFVNEIYKGSNKTIGFKYSTPDEEFNLSGMIFSNLKITQLKKLVNEELDKNVESYLCEIEKYNELKNVSAFDLDEKGKEKEYKYEYVYFYNIDFEAYSKLEIISLFHYFYKNLDKNLLIFPTNTVYLNDEKFDELPLHKKNKIGY